jgi:hypothetical protein
MEANDVIKAELRKQDALLNYVCRVRQLVSLWHLWPTPGYRVRLQQVIGWSENGIWKGLSPLLLKEDFAQTFPSIGLEMLPWNRNRLTVDCWILGNGDIRLTVRTVSRKTDLSLLGPYCAFRYLSEDIARVAHGLHELQIFKQNLQSFSKKSSISVLVSNWRSPIFWIWNI